MNANELASYIEDEYLNDMECEHGFLIFENGGCPNECCKRQDFYKAVTMLRQQQAEIEELKAKLGCDPAYFDMPARKLTDEEVTDVFVECLLPYGEFDEHEFAKAILRKAQKK